MSRLDSEKINPKVNDILGLLGGGAMLAAFIVLPGLALVAKDAIKMYEEEKRKKEFKQWERFNLWRLRALLKRLREQKIVEVREINGEATVVLTQKGKTKYLKGKIEGIMINKPPRWDGKWRLVIYDIAQYKRQTQQAFRETLKKMKFLCLQKSVYLYPYPCQDEIELLRQYYGIGDEVILLMVGGIENEEAYKRYFGL